MTVKDDQPNGFYIKNSSTYDYESLIFEAYDANLQRMWQRDPPIPKQGIRWVATDHIGSADFIYVLCFYTTDNFNPPPGIGIVSDSHGDGSGGGLSFSILGTGFGASGSGSVTVTGAFSQPSLVARMDLKEYKTPTGIKGHESHRWSCMEVINPKNEEGEEILQAVFVEDAQTGKEIGPPGWDNKWYFGGVLTKEGGWLFGC